jgi:hypothetical protein
MHRECSLIDRIDEIIQVYTKPEENCKYMKNYIYNRSGCIGFNVIEHKKRKIEFIYSHTIVNYESIYYLTTKIYNESERQVFNREYRNMDFIISDVFYAVLSF